MDIKVLGNQIRCVWQSSQSSAASIWFSNTVPRLVLCEEMPYIGMSQKGFAAVARRSSHDIYAYVDDPGHPGSSRIPASGCA